jgi:hypothetical protein
VVTIGSSAGKPITVNLKTVSEDHRKVIDDVLSSDMSEMPRCPDDPHYYVQRGEKKVTRIGGELKDLVVYYENKRRN